MKQMKQEPTKQQALMSIMELTQEIDGLSDGSSLATLDHKIKKRHEFLLSFFDQYIDDINPDEMKMLQGIQRQTSTLVDVMHTQKNERGNELLKSKRTGTRMKLYTSIAKQK